MQIQFHTLSLNCKKGKEILDLNYQVLFYHGEISSGKSSIARLISFCLGGDLERTTAIKQEVISVNLELSIGINKVLFERDIQNDSFINATWIDDKNNSFNIDIPVSGSAKAVWADSIYNISDLIFYLLDIKVLRIPASKNREDTGLVRLTLRNFMWFCYLDQSKLDSSFYRQEDATKARNSREVLKYILQYSTQKLLELEEKLYRSRKKRQQAIATAKGLRDFLRKFGFSTETEIESQVVSTNEKLKEARETRKKFEEGYSSDTHSSDELRYQIRSLIKDITILENGILDIESRIRQQESLRSELVASKFKLAKSNSIATVFQNIHFDNCPDCGTYIKDRQTPDNSCNLCGSDKGHEIPISNDQTELLQVDLNERISELETSIDLHKKSLRKTLKQLSAKRSKRAELDAALQKELRQYESIFLSRIRSVDQEVAKYQERAKGLNRLKQMPKEISSLEEEAKNLSKAEELIKEQMVTEQQKIVRGESLIEELEQVFLKTLTDVGVPGVSSEDVIYINRKTFEVQVWPKGEEYLHWNFYSAGSGGKKTLFNSCFLLSLHVVAARHDLPLPTFIVIDTPMKNIDKEVNQDIFRSFYNYLYDLATSILNKTQFIIIDNNYVTPSPELKISFFERYMTDNDPLHPPLIKYYIGA